MSWVSFTLLFLALLCLAAAVREILAAKHGRGRERAASRLRASQRASRATSLIADPEDEDSILRGDAVPGHAEHGRFGYGLLRKAQILLVRAGLKMGPGRLLLISLGCSVLAGWISLGLWPLWLPALVASAIGALLPWAVVLQRKRRRTRLFEQQLPEALGLICRALRAGHALTSGIEMVSKELDAPIAEEFGRVSDEISLGLETRQALAHLCERVDVPDLAFFSVAVLIQRETGGNLAEIMERLAHVIRERHIFYGKVHSMTAQNRGAALILLAAPFAFLGLMYRASPDFILPLFETSGGHVLAMIAGGLTFFGYAAARRLAVVHV